MPPALIALARQAVTGSVYDDHGAAVFSRQANAQVIETVAVEVRPGQGRPVAVASLRTARIVTPLLRPTLIAAAGQSPAGSVDDVDGTSSGFFPRDPYRQIVKAVTIKVGGRQFASEPIAIIPAIALESAVVIVALAPALVAAVGQAYVGTVDDVDNALLAALPWDSDREIIETVAVEVSRRESDAEEVAPVVVVFQSSIGTAALAPALVAIARQIVGGTINHVD